MMLDTMTLILEPAESADFKVGATRVTDSNYDKLFTQLTYYIHDMLTQPLGWSSLTFGTFSSVKYRFMSETIPSASASSWTATNGPKRLPILREALAAYELANGPLIDESNNRVTF